MAIKVETLGMIDVAKNNPLLISTEDVANYSFIIDDGITYLIANTVVGDKIYEDDVTFAAGTYLRGFDVSAWVNQKLVIDGKHIDGTAIADITVGSFLKVADEGKLSVSASEPTDSVYFKVTDVGVTLTEQAVKARVCVGAGE